MTLIKKLNEFGKRRANIFARVANNLKLSDTCECTDDVVCKIQQGALNSTLYTGVSVLGYTFNINTQIKDFSGEIIWTPTRYEPNGFAVLDSLGFVIPANVEYVQSFLEAILSMFVVDVSITSTTGTFVVISAVGFTMLGANIQAQNVCCDYKEDLNDFDCR